MSWILINGGTMNIRIEKKQSFNCIGIKSEKLTPFSPKIEEMWLEVMSNGNFGKIFGLANTDFKGIHGICEPQSDGLIYYIATASTKEAPEGMHKVTVPASTWFIMSGEGKLPDALQGLWHKSFEAISTARYRQIQSICFERYLDFENDLTSKFEIWIAVEKI